MLRAYIQKLTTRCTDAAVGFVSAPPRSWTESALADLIALDGKRETMLRTAAILTGRAKSRLHQWLIGDDDGGPLARTLLGGCERFDNGKVWHKELKLRSYVDISIQVKLLGVILRHLSEVSQRILPVTALEIAELLLQHEPNSRPALLVHASLLLEGGDPSAAIASIERALRVQAVCTTAQEMLFAARRMARDQGAAGPEHDQLDYDLSDKFCRMPFDHLSTGFRGEAFACACPSWVPFSVGNVLEAPSGDAVWNSPVAMEIRRSILDGDFSYCSKTQCSFLRLQKLPRKSEVTTPQLRHYIDNHLTRVEEMPAMLELNHDPTCNLACPSCRTEIVSAKAEEVDLYAAAAERVILPMLRKVNGLTYISGGGEALASKHFRSILRRLNREEFPGLSVYLLTNGLLLTPHRWSEFPHLPEMLGTLSISIDAACAATYETLRRPGKWATLTRNLERVAAMRRGGEIRYLSFNFVVQKANFREMLDFVAFAEAHAADHVWFQRAVNYGAYDEATFADVDVSSPSHPDHAELLEILRNPILHRPSVNMHMLSWLLPEMVASDETLDFLY